MNKSTIEAGQPGTTDQQRTTADSQQVSQPNANTNVVGSLFKSREIKFRAWLGNRMEYQVLAGQLGNFFAHEDSNDKDCCYNTKYTDNVPVMQYTGLKDKNGKEIYEGDILNGRNNVLKIVYWCDKRAAFCESEQFKPTQAKHSFAKLYDKFGKVFNKNGILENHFIVGNVFENPELLEPLR